MLNLYLYMSKIVAKFWKSVIGSDQIDKRAVFNYGQYFFIWSPCQQLSSSDCLIPVNYPFTSLQSVICGWKGRNAQRFVKAFEQWNPITMSRKPLELCLCQQKLYTFKYTFSWAEAIFVFHYKKRSSSGECLHNHWRKIKPKFRIAF